MWLLTKWHVTIIYSLSTVVFWKCEFLSYETLLFKNKVVQLWEKYLIIAIESLIYNLN